MTLADEIMGALPSLMAVHPQGPTVAILADQLSADSASVRLAVRQLDDDCRAKLCRRGKAWHLLPADDPTPVCPVCMAAFERPRKSERITCGRSCAVALSWRNEATRERKSQAIRAALATPKARARLAAHNKRRWAKPEERAKLSEQNRRYWADPVNRAARSAAIAKQHGTPEYRAKASEIRRRFWRDPVSRRKMVEGIRRSKQTPEARAKFSALLRARWQDPVWRAKWMAAVRANALKAAEKTRGKRQPREQVQKRIANGVATKRRRNQSEAGDAR